MLERVYFFIVHTCIQNDAMERSYIAYCARVYIVQLFSALRASESIVHVNLYTNNCRNK